jgi:hypothetical protein
MNKKESFTPRCNDATKRIQFINVDLALGVSKFNAKLFFPTGKKGLIQKPCFALNIAPLREAKDVSRHDAKAQRR